MVTITVDSPIDGQELAVPFSVSGNADAGAGRTVVALEIQIDSAAPHPMPVPNPAVQQVPFSLIIAEADCPNVDTWYMVSVYAWDDQGSLTIEARSFKRVDIDDNEEEPTGL